LETPIKQNFEIPIYILASKNTRAINFIIDLIVIYFLSLVIYQLSSYTSLNKKYVHYSDWIDTFDSAQAFLFRSLIWFVYYGLTEFFLSRTLAKYFTKTIVVLKNGSKPNFFDIMARTILRLFPFEQFTFLKGRKPGLHDEYSKTFVVKKTKLERAKKEFLDIQKIGFN
jgi:uncharacterized RDD family membrane protein YckC